MVNEEKWRRWKEMVDVKQHLAHGLDLQGASHLPFYLAILYLIWRISEIES